MAFRVAPFGVDLYGFQPVLKPSVFVMMKVLQQITPMVAHTSGILRFCRCLRGAEASVVTTQRSAGGGERVRDQKRVTAQLKYLIVS